MKDEGPSAHTIPTHTRTICGMCKFHVCTGSFHTRIGPGSWREYTCKHPDAWEQVTDGDAKKAELRGMLRTIEDGRHIGRTEQTPDWCPFTRPVEAAKQDAEETVRQVTAATTQLKPRTPLFRGRR